MNHRIIITEDYKLNFESRELCYTTRKEGEKEKRACSLFVIMAEENK